jgi:hypothetical protein
MYDKNSAVVDTEFQMFEFENGVCVAQNTCVIQKTCVIITHI